MGDFSELFGDAIDGATAFMKVMLPVAAVLCFSALLQAARAAQSGDMDSLARRITAIGFIAVLIFLFPDWMWELTETIDRVITDDLDYDVSATSEKFVEKVTAIQIDAGDEDEGAIDFVVGLFKDGVQSIFVSLISGVLFLLGHFAAIVQWWAYMFQEAARVFAIAMAPLMLPMFLFQSTRAVAVNYVMSLIGIMMWPVGWALAGILTDGMLTAASDKLLYDGAAALPATFLLMLIGAMASIWVLFSTFIAPVAISKAITTGVQVGTSLLSGTAGFAVGATVASSRAASAASSAAGGGGGGGGGGGAGSDMAQAGLAMSGGAQMAGGGGKGAGSAAGASIKAAGIISRAK